MSTRVGADDAVRLFRMSTELLEADLDRVESEFGVDLGRKVGTDNADRDEFYYPQFSDELRAEAARMAEHYEIFYCLENSIRSLVRDALIAANGPQWWEPCVSDHIRAEVATRTQKEIDSGVTVRSDDPLDYTTFGELGEIIKSNWTVFGAMLNSQKAVTSIMTRLNTLRAPIAHSTELAEDEIERLRLSVRDWFRQMEAKS